MSVLFFLVPLSLLIAFIFLGAFFWAVLSNQYENLDEVEQILESD